MRKAIFVLVTTVATAAVVAVGTSAFAVAIAPPDEHGQVQDLPSIISGTWSPVQFDLKSAAVRSPVAVAGPVAEPIGQQAKEGPTTDTDTGVTGGAADGAGDAGATAPGSTIQSPATPGGDAGAAAKAEKEKKDKEAKDKAEKEKKDKEAKDRAAKEAKDKAEKEKKDNSGHGNGHHDDHDD